MLQLAFEASGGNLRLITQTSQQFAGGPSASVRYLDLAGINVERVLDDPPRPGGRKPPGPVAASWSRSRSTSGSWCRPSRWPSRRRPR